MLLKERKIQDNESEEILDTIFNNRVYDLGVIFNWGGNGGDGLASFMNKIAFNGSNTFVSTYDSIKDRVQSDIDTTIASYQ
jgi:hypothetical protein